MPQGVSVRVRLLPPNSSSKNATVYKFKANHKVDNILQYSSRQDQFGFYQVGDLKFYSRLEAIQTHDKTGKPLHWNFNDEVYSSYDWSVEPTETLEELYRQRAQQLRDEYDYLILWFSGGADSTNILNTFVNNDIKLDEVASYVNYESTGSTVDHMNGEIYNVAMPLIKKIQEQKSWPKHTIVDIAQATIDFFKDPNAKFDWIYHTAFFPSPNTLARSEIKTYVPSWVNMFDAGKRVAFIHGIDKPHVGGIANGNFYFTFANYLDTAHTSGMQISDRPWEFDEIFYWSPKCPTIPIKQGHIVKQFLKTASASSPLLVDFSRKLPSSTVINGKMFSLSLDGTNLLVYPDWKPVPFQIKSWSNVFTPRDTWFFNLPDTYDTRRSWRLGLEHLWDTVPDHFKNNPQKIETGLKRINSKSYNLGS